MQVQDESRIDVRKILTPVTAQQSLQKTLPFPCKKQYTVVILMPQASRFERLKSFITDAKVSYKSQNNDSLQNFYEKVMILLWVGAGSSWIWWYGSFGFLYLEICTKIFGIIESVLE